MKQTIEEAASEYMNIPPVKAAIKCGDIEDLESHIKVAFKNGAEWKHEKAIEAFRLFVEKYCAESGRTDISEDSEHYMKVFNELINE
jgi:hypothetical protein